MGVKIIAFLKAKEGMTREQLRERWVKEHAPLTLKFPHLKGYRINIPIDEYQDLEELPFDGTAELWFDSLEEMKADYATDEAKAAVADARSFTDVLYHIYMEEHVAK